MNTLPPFKLERYFAQYEFSAPYLLSASDCESLTMRELLDLADADSLMQWEKLALSYTEGQGLTALREEVSAMTPGLTPDDVLILAPEEGIFIAMLTLLEPGDHIVGVWPAYQSLYDVAHWRGCEFTPWRARSNAGEWEFDLDDLQHCITSCTKLLIINFPHNPTGCLLSRDRLDQIILFADQHKLAIFSDEMYRGLEYDHAERLPAVCELYDQGISLSGFSKAYALPGLRIGWLATRNREWMKRWQIAKDYTTICSSAPSEVLALMAIRARQHIIERNRAIITENLSAARLFFSEFASRFTWLPPHAGTVAFPLWRGEGSIEQFCQQVLATQRVMIVPGSLFDMKGNYFRIGLGRRNFVEALGKVRSFVNTL